MGLDITAISEIEPIEIPEGIELWSDEYYDWEEEQNLPGGVWNLYQSPNFPEQGEGLPNGTVVAMGEEFGHRAGSYSGYNEWRNDLALAAGYEGGAEEVFALRVLRVAPRRRHHLLLQGYGRGEG